MLLTEEQAKARLESNKNLLSRFRPSSEPELEKGPSVVSITEMPRGGGNGRELDKETKIAIAARARTGERHKDLAAEFGVSRQAVSYLNEPGGRYGRGKLDEDAVQDRIDQLQDVALVKLMASLDLIDRDKLGKLGAKDLSAVAGNLSKIIGNTRTQGPDSNQVHLHLYAPELRKESSFKVVEVSSV